MKSSTGEGTHFCLTIVSASFGNKQCTRRGGHGLTHVYTCRVMSFQCGVVSRVMVVGGWCFPDHCGTESLYELGLSAIIPHIAAGYSILSKFHFLCAYVLLLLSSSLALDVFLLSSCGYETSFIFWCSCTLLRPRGILFVSLQTMFEAVAQVQINPTPSSFLILLSD